MCLPDICYCFPCPLSWIWLEWLWHPLNSGPCLPEQGFCLANLSPSICDEVSGSSVSWPEWRLDWTYTIEEKAESLYLGSGFGVVGRWNHDLRFLYGSTATPLFPSPLDGVFLSAVGIPLACAPPPHLCWLTGCSLSSQQLSLCSHISLLYTQLLPVTNQVVSGLAGLVLRALIWYLMSGHSDLRHCIQFRG